jgi:hypothetical protein
MPHRHEDGVMRFTSGVRTRKQFEGVRDDEIHVISSLAGVAAPRRP